jgi:hypothetical protein
MKPKAAACQYTIRNVPKHVDQALRRRAKASGKSINQVAVEALIEGSADRGRVYSDLDCLVGSLSHSEAKAMDRELAEQRGIDEKLCAHLTA